MITLKAITFYFPFAFLSRPQLETLLSLELFTEEGFCFVFPFEIS